MAQPFFFKSSGISKIFGQDSLFESAKAVEEGEIWGILRAAAMVVTGIVTLEALAPIKPATGVSPSSGFHHTSRNWDCKVVKQQVSNIHLTPFDFPTSFLQQKLNLQSQGVQSQKQF